MVDIHSHFLPGMEDESQSPAGLPAGLDFFISKGIIVDETFQ